MRNPPIQVGDTVWYWQLDDHNKPRPMPAVVTDIYEKNELGLFVMFSREIGNGGGSRTYRVERAPGPHDFVITDNMPMSVVNHWTRKPP